MPLRTQFIDSGFVRICGMLHWEHQKTIATAKKKAAAIVSMK